MTDLDGYFLEAFDCADCQENTFIKNEYYMLHDKIWCSVASKFEMLCISCFEKRLGRPLFREDFVDKPINFGCIFSQSKLLFSRINTKNNIKGIEQNV